MKLEVFPVILAGGKGERFWPYSRSGRPKQMLPLTSDRSMMEIAVDQARALAKGNPVHLVIGSNLENAVKSAFAMEKDVIVVAEPEGRDTAAAVALGAQLVRQRNPEGVMVVLTADHQIGPIHSFQRTLESAVKEAAKGSSLLTLGIRPDRPETGFGYVELKGVAQADQVADVERFVEKPNLDKAREYVASGRFLWNSGMFVWRVDYFWSCLKGALPEIANLFEAHSPLDIEKISDQLTKFYPMLKKVSIDYGLLEQAPKIQCVPAGFDWDDVGSWTALERIHPLDERGNLNLGQNVVVDCDRSTVFSHARSVVAWGLQDVLIADVDGVTVVCPKDRVADLKNLIAEVRQSGRTDLL
jgi:mannose-1-phosphate guanylyltransferase